jgi:zinc/manganese transport system substrate-binding protein
MRQGVTLFAIAAAVGLACGALIPAASAVPAARVGVVAAENFYGDLVHQIAGDNVAVTSIISDPTVDPHLYETNAKDAAAVANARLIVQNGLGYDTFMDHLIAASPNPQRKEILVARLTGHKPGDNMHLWYDPQTMPQVAQAVTDALVQLDPVHAVAYRDGHQRAAASLASLAQRVATFKARFAGTPVAVTEPVFNYMAQAIGLIVRTPEAFQKAIEDGRDPPAQALAQTQDLLTQHRVKVLLYNTQTVSPITTKIQQLARQAGIPVVGVSETEPPKMTYQRWMLDQLNRLGASLGKGM